MNEDFVVHYEKRSIFVNDFLSESRTMSLHDDIYDPDVENNSIFSRIARVIMRQVFFDLVLNVQQVLFFAIIGQIMANGV